QAAAPITQDQYVARIDHTFSERDSLSGSYIFNTQADDTVPTFQWDTRGNRGRAQNFSLAETHVFTPSMVNELRAGWHRFYETEFFGTSFNPSLDIGNQLGIAGLTSRPRDYGPPTFSAGYAMPSVRGV